MAELVIETAVKLLVGSLISVISDEIRLTRGVNTELVKLKKSLESVGAFLDDVAKRQLEDATVKLWLKNLENVAYLADNVLDEFRYETHHRKVEIQNQMKRKVCFFFNCTNPLVFRSKMARKIRDVVKKLNALYQEADGQGLRKRILESPPALPLYFETSSIGNDPIVVGRDNDVSKIVHMLINPTEEVLSVLPITGMGGLGKTTLARLIFKDPKTIHHFDETIWVCVSENFDAIDLFNRMLKSSGSSHGHENVLEAVVKRLQGKLNSKRYLLILDDLWNEKEDEWSSFKNTLLEINSKSGSFIITTTRFQKVASLVATLPIFDLDELSAEECWSIINRKAFRKAPAEDVKVPAEFVSIGMEIAGKCGGLPLAASMIGATLRKKSIEVWSSVSKDGLSDFNKENGVQKILKISYDRLPSLLLKKCFAYCSIFCKDERLEKERLVQLWMAEGLLGRNGDEDMESKGNMIYDSLLQYSFLQEAVKDKYGNVEYSKMHDLVHDLAMTASEGVSFNEENYPVTTIISSQVRYLGVKSFDAAATNIREEDSIYLRTLVCRSDISDNNFFKHLTHLRILDLRRSWIKELASLIGNLIHLRLLDVTSGYLRSLPESICLLFNLQTLRALFCSRLPDQLNLFSNLRHLIVSLPTIGEKEMPFGIRKLTCLRTLPFFNVGDEVGRRVDELGDLKNLCGNIQINNLERVNNVEEATKARLIEKPNIQVLVLVWHNSGEGNNKDQEVLDSLRPHQNLKRLEIKGFRGDNFPLWTMKMARLNNLIEICLVNCERCQQVPTLGHLPQLKVLKIDALTNVKSIGPPFYYLHDGTELHTAEMCPQEVPFPALESLILQNMHELATWNVAAVMPQGFNGFPMLKYLKISNCGLLSSIPHHDFTHLQSLEIITENDSLLFDIISNDTTFISLRSLIFQGTYNSYSSHGELTHLELPDENGVSLKELVLQGLHSLISVKCTSGKMLGLTFLANLKVSRCSSLASFEVDWKKMSCLKHASISECPNWKSMPRDIGGLHGLRILNLEFITTDGFELALETLQAIRGLKSLDELSLGGTGEWASSGILIPDQLQYFTTLTTLQLRYFGVEILPEWLGNLASLRKLEIFDFKNLQHLASEETMQRLSKLESLCIHGSPLLGVFFTHMCPDYDNYSAEAYKISHIPNVIVAC